MAGNEADAGEEGGDEAAAAENGVGAAAREEGGDKTAAAENGVGAAARGEEGDGVATATENGDASGVAMLGSHGRGQYRRGVESSDDAAATSHGNGQWRCSSAAILAGR